MPTLPELFAEAVAGDPAPPDPGYLPSRLCRAAREVLPFDGASLSLWDGVARVPLGSSDADAGRAERLQFTAGSGPCMDALRDDVIVYAATEVLEQRWPALADLWLQNTPFHSVLSVPMSVPDDGRIALDLLRASDPARPDPTLGDVVGDAVTVARLVADELGHVLGEGTDSAPLRVEPALGRGRLWIAAGMVAAAHGIDAVDAVDRLRSYSFANGTTVDETAGRVVARTLATGDLAL